MNPIRKMKSQPWYMWVISGCCFIMVFTCLGFCSSTKPMYLSAITDALNIERSLFSINDSCRYITTAVINLFFGALIAKFGPRKLIAAGFLALCASMLTYSFAENIVVFSIGGCLLGLGLAWCTTTMVGYVVGRWCKKHRGTIMGAILAANGLGGALAAQIVGPIIRGSEDGFGYRKAYLVTAAILFAVGAIVVTLFKNAPDNEKAAPVVGKKKPKGELWSGITFAQCLRTPYFYIACVCIFMTGMCLQGVNGVYKAHMNDVGIDAAYGDMVVSVHSLTLAGFKFLTGIIHDKKGMRFTMVLCDVAAVVMAIMLVLVAPTSFGMVMAMGYGVLCSMALPLETIMLPLLAGDLFGEKDYAKMLGIFVSVNTTGYAVGAPLTNLIYDIFGTYVPAFYFVAGTMVVVAVVFQFALNAAEKKKHQVELEEASAEA